MEEPTFKFGSCMLFLSTVWVELPSDNESAILLKPLSFAKLSSIQELHYLKQQDPSYFKHETYQSILENSVVDTRNIFDFPSYKILLEQLPPTDVKYLYDRLLELSTVTSSQLDELSSMLEIQFNPQFRDESWDCSICQSRKLDYNRACGFLPEDKRDPKARLPRVGQRRFTQCPISTIDGYVTRQASMAYSLMEAGVLPEAGGIGSQTEWFVKAAIVYKRKVAEAERQATEAIKNKNK